MMTTPVPLDFLAGFQFRTLPRDDWRVRAVDVRPGGMTERQNGEWRVGLESDGQGS